MVDIMPDVLVPYTQIIVSYVNWFLLPMSSRNEMDLAINSLCPASGVVTDHAHRIYSDCIILDLVLYWQSGIRPRLKIHIDRGAQRRTSSIQRSQARLNPTIRTASSGLRVGIMTIGSRLGHNHSMSGCVRTSEVGISCNLPG